ncbi:3-deoxy-D-manno-octulosonic-acid transferase [Litorimonas taeanensis]|uniref:3-deoxy-D-manno-octulosonic acid transferase n=1 Tax=Litorimonas taeanensis TaxID=568099 RepID=A0A420WDL3_9PROT|nr:3-deoxy-D-manno-octulosonic acid transferase [Litorimonas taeanensis]RKQ69107.1 3-deoxy-D-manno-octulosonic-acid transferase [Litorimonas taeanensis]
MKKRYALTMRLLSIIAPLWLRKRVKDEKEDKERIKERYGRSSLTRPNEGRLIWMHGASVGETKTFLPLISEILESHPDYSVLVTSGTKTSADLMVKTLPDRAVHQYIPLDAPQYVTRFLNHWKPDMAIWMESEIWPNLIFETSKRKIPMALINARLNPKSMMGWNKRHKFAQSIFEQFDTILPSDTPTAHWLSELLGRDISSIGNLKYDAPPLSFDIEERSALLSAIGNRKIWTAASIHGEEMDRIIAAQKTLKHQSCLVMVPRHPSDAGSRMFIADHPNLKFARRSKNQIPKPETDIYLFDTFGEMGLAYSLADLTVIGGSLAPSLLGHNPLEPVRLNIPTFTGPHIASFAEIYAPYLENNGIKTIEDHDSLAQIVGDMLSDPTTLDAMRKNSANIISENGGTLQITLKALEALLDKSKGSKF